MFGQCKEMEIGFPYACRYSYSECMHSWRATAVDIELIRDPTHRKCLSHPLPVDQVFSQGVTLELKLCFLSLRPSAHALFLVSIASSSVLQRPTVKSTNSNLSLPLPESNTSVLDTRKSLTLSCPASLPQSMLLILLRHTSILLPARELHPNRGGLSEHIALATCDTNTYD